MKKVRDGVYIGDIQDGQRNVDNTELTILTVCPVFEKHELRNSHYIPLQDGENEQTEFNTAVRKMINLIRHNRPVLVHCNMGVSRSATILATALSRIESISFDKALQEIEQHKPNVNPSQELRVHAQNYLSSSVTKK